MLSALANASVIDSESARARFSHSRRKPAESEQERGVADAAAWVFAPDGVVTCLLRSRKAFVRQRWRLSLKNYAH